MTERPEAAHALALAGRVFIASVIVAGVSVIGLSVYQLHAEPLGSQWYMLAALTLISGSATVKLPSIPATISVSETFVFASILLFGSAAGTVTVALDGLVISFWMAKRRPEWYRAVFNMAAPALSIWCASQILFRVAGVQPLIQEASSVNLLLAPLIVFALVYFALNSWLIAMAVAFETHSSPYRIWRENFLWLSLNYFCGASVALLLVVYTRDVDLGFIGVIVPLLLVFYVTFKTSMGRVEDANAHLTQLNRLYLSTIETLAMAIDAKDQITHGHIRRVQILAVRLARRVGVTDDGLIRAVEAAALLHDMGKLAVPEYILNKPGKLNPAEFEKMKLHATVGADILTAIDFPYPVVPIVRHHHENWDGTGYPAALKGTSIPIGARILAVVDCFDALTSDRPYRPRLGAEAALKILVERRGSMYDPIVVDTFVHVCNEINPGGDDAEVAAVALDEIAHSSNIAQGETVRLDEITASADEMLTLYELARALAGQSTITETGDLITKHLRRLIPSSLFVFYLYNKDADELEARYALGDGATVVKGLRIAIGQRLSGWVAANRQTISNSDPLLDLGEVARSITPRLQSTLCAPLTSDEQLVGVLTIYSTVRNGFTDDHRRILELVGEQIGTSLKHAAESEMRVRRDPLESLPNLVHLQRFAEALGKGRVSGETSFTLLFIDVTQMSGLSIDDDPGTDALLRRVASQAMSALRPGDILFRYGNHQFVALLNEADPIAATSVARQIGDKVHSLDTDTSAGKTISIGVSFATVCAPRDGTSLTDLIDAAKARLAGEAESNHSTIH